MGDVMNGEELNGVVASVRKLSHSDLPALLSLLPRQPAILRIPRRGADAGRARRRDGSSCLPAAPQTKVLSWLLRCRGNLIAVLWPRPGYPAEGCAFIGFFMVDALSAGDRCREPAHLTVAQPPPLPRAFLVCASPTSRGTSSPAASGRSAASVEVGAPIGKVNIGSYLWSTG